MNEVKAGRAVLRDIVFEHPTKGFIVIQFKKPTKMKFDKILEYLELEDEFLKYGSIKSPLKDTHCTDKLVISIPVWFD